MCPSGPCYHSEHMGVLHTVIIFSPLSLSRHSPTTHFLSLYLSISLLCTLSPHFCCVFFNSSATFSITTIPLSLFFSPPVLLLTLSPPPPPLSHLSDLNTCIMYGEGRAVGRAGFANNAQCKHAKKERKSHPGEKAFSL